MEQLVLGDIKLLRADRADFSRKDLISEDETMLTLKHQLYEVFMKNDFTQTGSCKCQLKKHADDSFVLIVSGCFYI